MTDTPRAFKFARFCRATADPWFGTGRGQSASLRVGEAHVREGGALRGGTPLPFPLGPRRRVRVRMLTYRSCPRVSLRQIFAVSKVTEGDEFRKA
jgi:hypothetical protein